MSDEEQAGTETTTRAPDGTETTTQSPPQAEPEGSDDAEDADGGGDGED